jgi:GAF domain-containing protein
MASQAYFVTTSNATRRQAASGSVDARARTDTRDWSVAEAVARISRSGRGGGLAAALRCVRSWEARGVETSGFKLATLKTRLALGVGLAGRVWSNGEPAWIPDVTKDPDFPRAAAAAEAGLRAGVSIPIVDEGVVVAVMEFFSRDVRPPDAALLTLLGGLGGQVGQFWARKQAERRALEEARLLATLGSAAQQLTRVTDPEEARPAVCQAALEISGAGLAQLFEPTSDGGLELTASVGVDLPPIRIGRGERSGALQALVTKKRLFVPDVRDDPHVSPRLAALADTRSIIFEPVLGESGVVGILVIAWPEETAKLPDQLASALPLLAAEAAVAIERTHLLKRLADAAQTDPLTGAANRRGLNGGDEFVVSFPDCSLGAGGKLVERLRGMTAGDQTFSAGLATWDGSESADDLIARADSALYEAKASGRDRVASI